MPRSSVAFGSAGLQSHERACGQSGAEWGGGREETVLSDALQVRVVEHCVGAANSKNHGFQNPSFYLEGIEGAGQRSMEIVCEDRV